MSYNLPSQEQTTAVLGAQNIGVGPTDDIQAILDYVYQNGGGTVYMETGTYTLTADLSVPPGVQLTGNARDNVIIDGNGSFGVQLIGSDSYTTGTVAITEGTDDIVGTGTTFTAGMVGRSILLSGLWYEIGAFIDTTHITLTTNYVGTTLAGYATVIAIPNYYPVIRDVTIINGDGFGLQLQYCHEPQVDNLIIYDCGDYGMEVRDTVFLRMIVGIYTSNTNLYMNNSWGWEINFSDIAESLVGPGAEILNSGSATVFDSAFGANATNGVSITSSNGIAFVSNENSNNVGQGIELISDNSDIQMYATTCANNGGDGIKLTASSDNCVIGPLSVKNNVGFGINIAAASCDNNILVGVIASNNNAGSLSDSGTGTLKSTTVNVLP